MVVRSRSWKSDRCVRLASSHSFICAKLRSAPRCLRADRVERRARSDIERSTICAAKRQAPGPLGNFENAQRLSLAIVDPDLTLCDVHVAGGIRDHRCAPALVEDGTVELAIGLECHAISA